MWQSVEYVSRFVGTKYFEHITVSICCQLDTVIAGNAFSIMAYIFKFKSFFVFCGVYVFCTL